MTTPTRHTITALCRIVKETQLREDHHNIGKLLDFIRDRKDELGRIEEALLWLMQDNEVTISMYIGPAIEQLSKRAAEAALEESRESSTGKR